MASKPLPSPEVLRQLLRYEPETGKLFWRTRPREMFAQDQEWKRWNTRYAEGPAFTARNTDGYPNGKLGGVHFSAHRVAWAMFFGAWPDGELDHINGTRSDNRIKNLRIATRAQNMHNQGVRKKNVSGLKGVYPHPKTGKWGAEIRVHGRRHYLGLYDKKEDAHRAYLRAARELHGSFFRST